mgnify:CR=1 FL=1
MISAMLSAIMTTERKRECPLLFPGKKPTLKRLLQFGIAIKRGGASLQDRMDKEKKPYIFVGLVCVREQYQGQGYMRKVLDIAFAEGDRLGVPVILETDAKSKCDKYVHLGMEL